MPKKMYGDNQQAAHAHACADVAATGEAVHDQSEMFHPDETGESNGPKSRIKSEEAALREVVATRLQRARRANGYKEIAVAERMGFSNLTMVSLFENAQRSPSLRNLVGLADIYGVSTDYVLGRTDDLERAPEEGNQAILTAAIKGTLAALGEQFFNSLAGSTAVMVESLSGDHALLDQVTEMVGEVRGALKVIRQHHGSQFDELRGGAKLERLVGQLEDTLTPRIKRKQVAFALAEYEHPVCDHKQIERAVQQLLLV